MLIITILGITTAISLSYFNTYFITESSKRILVILIFSVTLILLTSNCLISLSSSNLIPIVSSFTDSISLGFVQYLFLLLLLSSLTSILLIRGLDSTRYLFLLTLALGSVLLICSTDFISIFIGLELQSYSVYLLAASTKNHEPSENAGLKYFLLGALSSTFILMGIVLLTCSTGSSNLEYNLFVATSSVSYTLILGLLLIIIGIMWKIAAAPLHAWSIDVYDAVPGKITAILSILPKIGLFYLIIRLLSPISQVLNMSTLTTSLSNIIVIIIILSLAIGSIMGLTQPRIKRLLAYSSVLNVGFILVSSLLVLNYSVAVFYAVQYILTTAVIWYYLNNFDSELTLNFQLQGLGSTNKVLAICLTLLILSTAGIPPMIGFFAKLQVIIECLQFEYFSLAVAAIIASLVSTVFYLNLVNRMWFRTSTLLVNTLNSLSTYNSRAQDHFAQISISSYFTSIIITLLVSTYLIGINIFNTIFLLV